VKKAESAGRRAVTRRAPMQESRARQPICMSVALPVTALAEASAGAPALPTHIGKYRILGRLGDGATSEVFLGYDDFQRRNVAIKRVRSSTSGDPIDGHYSERFFAAEAALVGKLQHPNVVQIFDAVPDPVAPYLVME
jgi:eukaryotic-like serine/threonine-protein kinase